MHKHTSDLTVPTSHMTGGVKTLNTTIWIRHSAAVHYSCPLYV